MKKINKIGTKIAEEAKAPVAKKRRGRRSNTANKKK